MPIDLTQLSHDDIFRLSADERARLASILLESVDERVDSFDLTDEQIRLLDERLAELDANPTSGRPWEDLLQDIRAKRCQNR